MSRTPLPPPASGREGRRRTPGRPSPSPLPPLRKRGAPGGPPPRRCTCAGGRGPVPGRRRRKGVLPSEPLRHRPENALKHLFFRDGGIDPDDPSGVGIDEPQIPLADGAVKFEGFPLDPARGAAAPRDAGEPTLRTEGAPP